MTQPEQQPFPPVQMTPARYDRPLGGRGGDDADGYVDPNLDLLNRVYGTETVEGNPQLRAAMLQQLASDPAFRSQMETRAGGLT